VNFPGKSTIGKHEMMRQFFQRKPVRINKYFDFIYTSHVYVTSLMLMSTGILVAYRLANNSLYDAAIVHTFWDGKYGVVGKVAILGILSIPTLVLPFAAWTDSEHRYYKHIIAFRYTYASRILMVLISTIAACISCYIASPGLVIKLFADGYFNVLPWIINSFLAQVSIFATLLGISFFTIFPFSQSIKIPKKLVKFTDFRPINSMTINLDIGALSPMLKVAQEELDVWHGFVEGYAPTATQVWESINFSDPSGQYECRTPIKRWPWEKPKAIWKGVNYLRTRLGSHLKCKSNNIIFVGSTTRAIQIYLEAVNPRKIIITDHDYLLESSLIEYLKVNRGVLIDVVQVFMDNDSKESWESDFVDRFVERCVQNSECTAIVSHVCYENGVILPVEKICKRLSEQTGSKISVIVDGAHAVGHVEVDLSKMPSAFYAFSGHKWLFGGFNLGVLVLPEDIDNSNNNSIKERITYGSYESLALPDHLLDRKLKLSQVNVAPMVTLTACLDALDAHNNFKNIRSNMAILRRLAIELLYDANSSFSISIPEVPDECLASGILNIQANDNRIDLGNVKKILEEKHNIVVSVVGGNLREKSIRICFPFYIFGHELKIVSNAIKLSFEEV
jgi:selenocysteine lyase/cysteine desulfurase